ncbi:MAG: integrase arm-type DNA-binding domain-containing protein [Bacteroidota bacterium]
MTTRLDQRTVDGLRRGGDPETLYDADVPGLRLRVGRRSASWVVVGTVNDGTSAPVSLTLGRADALTLREARAQARELRLRLSRGEDPREARRRQDRDGTTPREALERHLAERPNLSARTVEYYRHWLEATGRWADRPLADMTRTDARRLFAAVTRDRGGYAANALARTCRAVWSSALRDLELPEGNVWSRAVRLNEERPRAWSLSDDELRAFWSAVDTLTNPVRAAAWETVALTGLRMNEVATLRWEDVDADEATAWVRSPKGGERAAFVRPLASRTVETLLGLRRVAEAMSSPFVFPAASRTGHVSPLRSGGGLPAPHALRSTWATRTVALDVELTTVTLALNHGGQGSTTWRYVDRRRVRAPVREATEAVAAELLRFRDERLSANALLADEPLPSVSR